MSEAMSDALSNLKDHAPTLPSVGDVRDKVQSHLPSVDIETVRDKARGKRFMMMLVGAAAGAAALFGLLRRRKTSAPAASVYTPPLPKP
jgi:hypothetical protein